MGKWAQECSPIQLNNGKGPPLRVAFSYIMRLEDMQAAVNKAYIRNDIVAMPSGLQLTTKRPWIASSNILPSDGLLRT